MTRTGACFLSIILCSQLTAQTGAREIADAIKINTLRHPYLFFTEEEKSVLKERIEIDERSRTIMEGLRARGNRYLRMPFEKQKFPEPDHPRFETSDGKQGEYISEITDGAFTCAFLYQMTGRIEYAKRGYEFAAAISDLPNWINPAHKFDIIYPRVWPRNVPDDQVVFSYDISAARMTGTLAVVYDWLYPALTAAERDKLRNALLEKAITRVRGNYEFFWWATAYRCNWSAICFSGLGISSLALLREHPQLADVVAESYNRLNLTFDQIGDDGGWQEGRGYYSYMIDQSLRYMDALKRLSKGTFNLFRHKNIRNHVFDLPLFALTAAFEDGTGRAVGNFPMLNKLVTETGDASAAWYREKFLHESDEDNIFEILWPAANVKPVPPVQASKLFTSIDWAIMRSDFFDPASVTIACKAGFNDDPHHGHLDCGHFILTWHDIPFIGEPGRMEYDEFYFNEDRYEYPHASSIGHNVVFVNGEQQITAKKKNQPWKEGIGGRILDFRTSAIQDYVLMDPSHSYPGKELKKWRRSIVLAKPVITLVLDEVSANPGATIVARFFPGVGGGQGLDQRRSTSGSSNSNTSSRGPAGTGSCKNYGRYILLTDSHGNMMAL
ncbi:MAG: heparinase II/III family protein, partial [Ignavibacteriales bacterium]|nr:heparinase II/III family protein [Ignavibacteriales bacterium]